MHGVDPRRRADAQAIEVVDAADGVREAEHAHQVLAVGRQRYIEQRVVVAVVAPQAEVGAGAVIHLDGGRQLAVDAGREAATNHALALLAGENVVIHVGRRLDDAIDDGVELNLLGLVGVVVRLLLVDFVDVADGKRAGIADAAARDDTHVLDAERRIGRQRHLEALGGQIRRRLAHALRISLDGGGAEDFDRRAGEAEVQPLGLAQILSSDLQLEGRPRLAAHREHMGQPRRRQLLRLGNGAKQKQHQRSEQRAGEGRLPVWYQVAAHRNIPLRGTDSVRRCPPLPPSVTRDSNSGQAKTPRGVEYNEHRLPVLSGAPDSIGSDSP